MMAAIDSTIKLTFRQKAFLGKLIDLYGEVHEPVHYSAVAGRLGLSNSSAYDMLRVLEQKDMVGSQYTTPKEVAGPGRANILFYPTGRAIKIFTRVAREINEMEEWENLKEGILKSLRQVKEVHNSKELLRELLEHAPLARTPLEQCAQLVTVFLLSLEEAKNKIADKGSINSIIRAPVSKLRMSILTGLVLGLSLADQKVNSLLGNCRRYTDKYEASMQKLNREGLVKLHRFIQEAWDALEA